MSVTRGEQIHRFHTQQQAEGRKHNELQMCWVEGLTHIGWKRNPTHVQLIGNKDVCLCPFIPLAQRQVYQCLSV